MEKKKKARNEMASILQHIPFPCYESKIWVAVNEQRTFPWVVQLFHDLGAAVTISTYYMLSRHGSSSIIPRIRAQVLALKGIFDLVGQKQFPCNIHSHQLSSQ